MYILILCIKHMQISDCTKRHSETFCQYLNINMSNPHGVDTLLVNLLTKHEMINKHLVRSLK